MTTNINDVFDLSPEEFHAQEERERIEAQQRREKEERAAREKKEAQEQLDKEAKERVLKFWTDVLTKIGEASTCRFEVRQREPYNQFRPCDLILFHPDRLSRGVVVPVGTGIGSGTSLEIHMQWFTARVDTWRNRREPAESVRSRMRKNGEFNYEALGVIARKYAAAQIAQGRKESALASTAGTVKPLVEELGYSSLEPSTNRAKPILFKFSMAREMTVDEARQAVALLRAAGYIAEKKETM